MIRTPHFQCTGAGSILGPRTKISHLSCLITWPKKKERESENTTQRMGKVFENYIPDKGLVRIHKKHKSIMKRHTQIINSNYEMGKGSGRTFF